MKETILLFISLLLTGTTIFSVIVNIFGCLFNTIEKKAWNLNLKSELFWYILSIISWSIFYYVTH